MRRRKTKKWSGKKKKTHKKTRENKKSNVNTNYQSDIEMLSSGKPVIQFFHKIIEVRNIS